ncbi:MAG: CapA family protein [Planctomycetota bacterium]
MTSLRLALCGDVMTGRGIDQVGPSPCDSTLHEPWVRDARDYVALAERQSGPIPRAPSLDWVWGDALAELERSAPAARIVNLETSVTRSDDWDRGKAIHYRMHPAHVSLLRAARVDVCALANNHVLDWGAVGLLETLETLDVAGLAHVGAGRDAEEAARPAVVTAGERRVLVFACGLESSGIPARWAAAPARPGVLRIEDLDPGPLGELLRPWKRPGDVVVLSIHWGGNWGYPVPEAHRRFAEAAVELGVDVVHGHSSHHPLGIEVQRGRLVLYGCGDFVNDYEGIPGHEELHPELRLLYLPDLGPDGALRGLRIVPFRAERFGLRRADEEELAWCERRLRREGRPLGSDVARAADGGLELRW